VYNNCYRRRRSRTFIVHAKYIKKTKKTRNLSYYIVDEKICGWRLLNSQLGETEQIKMRQKQKKKKNMELVGVLSYESEVDMMYSQNRHSSRYGSITISYDVLRSVRL
jgi:hypothetical protein